MKSTIVVLFLALCISMFGIWRLSIDRDLMQESAERWMKLSDLQTKNIMAWSEYATGQIDLDSLMVTHKTMDNELQSFRLWIVDK